MWAQASFSAPRTFSLNFLQLYKTWILNMTSYNFGLITSVKKCDDKSLLKNWLFLFGNGLFYFMSHMVMTCSASFIVVRCTELPKLQCTKITLQLCCLDWPKDQSIKQYPRVYAYSLLVCKYHCNVSDWNWWCLLHLNLRNTTL